MTDNQSLCAVLMPTCGRPDVVEDTLRASLIRYKKFNFDVYIFDSNKDNCTKDIVKELQKEYDNLYYVRMCEFIHLDCKWLDMVRGYYLRKDYEYIFPCGDGNSLTEFSLERVCKYLKEKVDVVNLLDFHRINKTSEFNNANDFFNSPHVNIGQWGGAIYNRKRLFELDDEEWNKAIEKWFATDLEYIGLNGFIYERISLCENLRIVVPSMDGAEPKKVLRRSRYKKRSFWRKDSIKLIGITYPKVYRKLPECYTNIESKIQGLIKANFQFKTFKYLKKVGAFNLPDYYRYKKIFDKEGVKVLNWKIFLLALIPTFKVFKSKK